MDRVHRRKKKIFLVDKGGYNERNDNTSRRISKQKRSRRVSTTGRVFALEGKPKSPEKPIDWESRADESRKFGKRTAGQPVENDRRIPTTKRRRPRVMTSPRRFKPAAEEPIAESAASRTFSGGQQQKHRVTASKKVFRIEPETREPDELNVLEARRGRRISVFAPTRKFKIDSKTQAKD